MTRLPQTAITERVALYHRLLDAFSQLDTAIERYNQAVADAYEALSVAVTSYNDCVSEAQDWVTTQAEAMQQYHADRSERWQDSPKGVAYQDWIDLYIDIDLEHVEFEAPETLGLDVTPAHEELENLPDAPDA